MAVQVLLRDQPQRSIALKSKDHVLIFRHSQASQAPPASSKATPSRCMVEFSKLDALQLSDYKNVQPKDVFGTLGLINVNMDTYLCVITAASLVATVRPGEEVQRIDAVEFCEHPLRPVYYRIS